MDRKELKQAGKNLFQKNYWYSVLVAFLMFFTGNIPSFSFSFNTTDMEYIFEDIVGGGDFKNFLEEFIETPFFIAISITVVAVAIVSYVLAYLIFASFRCGGIRYFLKSRKNQPAQIHEVFANLKDKTNFNIAKVTFFRDLSVALWSFLFIIPGIIKAYEYWAIDYILAVRPDIDKDEAKRLSKILMDGNKWNLFELSFSFLGWIFLSMFTFGLLNIFYLDPYMQATFVEFFSEIRLEALAKGTISPNDIPDYEYIDPQTQYQAQYYQQPKNIVYRPDGTPMGNTVYTQQPFQQPIQQPYTQPVQQAFTQPIQQPVVETPVAEPIVEEPEENNPDTTN